MPSCVVKCCKNNSTDQKKCQGITYHRFPKNTYRKADWVDIIRDCRGEDDWNPSRSSTVCSAHFDDVDFKTTLKGLRYLTMFAIPKKLLLKSPRISKIKPSNLQQTSQYDGEAEPEQPPSASGNILPSLLQVFVSAPVHNEEPTLAGYCRLCAASGLKDRLVDMKNDTGLRKLVVNMSTRLNTNIDFTQEHLPTTICSACIKALYTAYDFVVGIDLAEVTLNKILSAQKLNDKKPEYLSPVNHVDLPHTTTHTTTHQITIKPEVVDEEQPPLEDVPSISIVPELSPKMEPESDVEPEKQWINVPSITAPVPVPQPSPEKPDNRPATNDSCAPSILESRLTIPIVFNPLREQYRQIEVIDKKRQIIDKQKKKIKVLNQKVRRLQDRNVSLKNILKKLHKHTNSDAESDD